MDTRKEVRIIRKIKSIAAVVAVTAPAWVHVAAAAASYGTG